MITQILIMEELGGRKRVRLYQNSFHIMSNAIFSRRAQLSTTVLEVQLEAFFWWTIWQADAADLQNELH